MMMFLLFDPTLLLDHARSSSHTSSPPFLSFPLYLFVCLFLPSFSFSCSFSFSFHLSLSKSAKRSSRGGKGRRNKDGTRNAAQYYSITFTCEFPHADDHAFIAMCYPYSFTDLTLYLKRLSLDPIRRHLFRWRSLCLTLAGNECPLLTITSFDKRDASTMKQRKGVVVTARVHPGESNASWMMKVCGDDLFN